MSTHISRDNELAGGRFIVNIAIPESSSTVLRTRSFGEFEDEEKHDTDVRWWVAIRPKELPRWRPSTRSKDGFMIRGLVEISGEFDWHRWLS